MAAATVPLTSALPLHNTALRVMAIAAAIAAPLTFSAGQAILPALPQEFTGAFAGMIANRDQLIAARLTTAAGAFLFLPATVPIWWLGGRALRGGSMIRAGVALLAVGTFFNALSQAVRGYVEEAATLAEPPAGSAVYSKLGGSATGLPIAYWSVPVFALGALGIAVGMLGSRGFPKWIPLLLIVGVGLSLVTAGAGPAVVLGLGPVSASFVGIAVLALRRGYLEPVAMSPVVGQSG